MKGLFISFEGGEGSGKSSVINVVKARLEAELQYYGEFSPQKHLFEQYKINYKDGGFM